MHRMRSLVVLFLGGAALLPPAAPSARADEASLAAFLERIASSDIDVRDAARREAEQHGAAAVAPLGKLIAGERTDVAISARAALERIVHHAGRQGADPEREATATALAGLLVPEAPAKLKREILHLAAMIGTESVVPAAARLLDDPDRHVREAARLALERLPNAAAMNALVAAAERGGDDQTPDLLFSLGKKRRPEAAPFLLKLAADKRGGVRFAALEALAHLGAPEAEPLFATALREDDAALDRPRLFTEYLRLADNLAAAGKNAEALPIYRQALERAPLDHQRERALLRLSPPGSTEGLDFLLAALVDPGDRVRKLGLARLAEMKVPAICDRLREAYGKAVGAAKPPLLRALAERDCTGTADLIAEAAAGTDADLKVVSLDLQDRLDNPELEALYLKVAEDGSPQARPVALKACLLVARRREGGEEAKKALALYANVLRLADDDTERSEALHGLARIGDPAASELVAPLLKNPTLATDAARALIAFATKTAAAGALDAAETSLMELVKGDFSRDLKAEAAAELRKLGRDPQRHIRAQGFVVAWWLVGPIEDRDGGGLEKKFFPEEVIELEKEQNIGARRFRWQKLADLCLEGTVNLVPIFRRSERRIAYAYAQIVSPDEREVLFKMGSDDGIACFLNDERIHLKNGPRGYIADGDSVPAKLRAGKNKVLLKISNSDGAWIFSFRITDREGKPLALETAQ